MPAPLLDRSEVMQTTGLRRGAVRTDAPGEVQASSDAVSTASLPKEFEPTCVISSLENQLRGRVPGMVREPLMSGFPPSAESRVTLANWQDPPYNRWSFQHLRELIPTQRISRGHGPFALPWRSMMVHRSLDDITVYRLAGHTSTFAEVIAETWTDAVVVLHDGQIVFEQLLRRNDRGDPPSADVGDEVRGRLHRRDPGRARPARSRRAGQHATSPRSSARGMTVQLSVSYWTCAQGSHSARSTPTRTPRSG